MAGLAALGLLSAWLSLGLGVTPTLRCQLAEVAAHLSGVGVGLGLALLFLALGLGALFEELGSAGLASLASLLAQLGARGGLHGGAGVGSARLGDPRGDLDLAASTDVEDLAVFGADVLEFAWQDLSLALDASGGSLGLGLGALGLGLVFRWGRRLLATRRGR